MSSSDELRSKQEEDVTRLIVSGERLAHPPGARQPLTDQASKAKPGEALIGTTIGGHYELIAVLGMGGMSVVYKANHVLLNKTVAIKLLSPQRILDEAATRRFQQEAKAACHLGHQNIVVTRDFGMDVEGRPFLVMDFVAGRSLDKLIAERNHRPMETAQTVRIITQIASAIAYAHKLGVIHRDIKPANIIVSDGQPEQQTATLVDFGIAKLVTGEEGQNLTQTGEIFGSPLYMSPEQCLGKKVDGRSDIYSLGCVMFEMLTGEPPFMGDGPLATLMMHVNDKPQFANSKSSGELVSRLLSIVRRCLAKDPAQRYQTTEEFSQDVQRAASMSAKQWGEFWKNDESFDVAPLSEKNESFFNGVLSDKVVKKEDTKLIWLAIVIVVGGILVASFALHNRSSESTIKTGDAGENWLNQGRRYSKHKQYAEALDAYEKAEKYNPDFVWLHQDKAEAYQQLGEETKAAVELKKQLEEHPYDHRPLVNAADTWKEQKRLDMARLYKAVADLDEQIKNS